MAARTARLLGHGLTEEKVAASLSVSGSGESSVVDVAATADQPRACDSDREHVHPPGRQRAADAPPASLQVRPGVGAQAARGPLAAAAVGTDGVELQDRAQTLGLLSQLDYGTVQVAQEAVPPTSPSSPKTSRNAVLGALLGLLIGLGLAFALERLDSRIKGPEDLEAIYRLPMLGVVPESSALSRPARRAGGKRTALPPADAEAFNLIRAHLRFFNVNRDLRTICHRIARTERRQDHDRPAPG